MTDEQIKKEFERWVNLGRPNVWVKKPGDEWKKVTHSMWERNEYVYIIDDRYAEIRKAFYDGETIQLRDFYYGCEWYDWNEKYEPKWNSYSDIRIKPEEPIYEWQWYYIDHKNGGRVVLSRNFHTNRSSVDVEENCFMDWKPFEPSKRVRKR